MTRNGESIVLLKTFYTSMGHICPNNAYSTVYCVHYSVPYTELLLAYNFKGLIQLGICSLD